jgi:hypothetical protein
MCLYTAALRTLSSSASLVPAQTKRKAMYATFTSVDFSPVFVGIGFVRQFQIDEAPSPKTI